MTIKNNISLICLILLFSFSLRSKAQDVKKDSVKVVTIKIVDSISMTPIDGALLIVTDQLKQQIFSGVSDKQGEIPNIKLNVLKKNIFYFNATGYVIKQKQVDFNNRDYATVGLRVSVQQLHEVTVLGALVTRDADRLRYKVASNKFIKGSDAIAVLQDVPLVNVNASGEIQIKNQKATILVNGKSVSEQYLRSIKADKIVSIDVITNPSSTNGIDKDINGIVNLKLKESDVPQLNVNLLLVNGIIRKMLFPGVTINGNTKKFFATMNLSSQSLKQGSTGESRIYRQQILKTQQTSNASMNYDALNASLDTYYNLSKLTQVSLGLNYSNADLKSMAYSSDHFFNPSDQLSSENTYLLPTSTFSISAEYNRKLSKGNIAVNYNFAKKSNKQESNFLTESVNNGTFSSLFLSSINKNIHSLQTLWSQKFAKDKGSFEMGGLVSLQDNTNDNSSAPLSLPTSHDFITIDEKLYAAFLTVRHNFGKYNVRWGARLENLHQSFNNVNSSYEVNYLNLFPNLVVKRKIGSKWDLIFNYRRKISRPDISILNPNTFQYSNIEIYNGNSSIRPEYHSKIDLNLNYTTSKSFYELSLYANRISNPILYLIKQEMNALNYNYVNLKYMQLLGTSISLKFPLNKTISLNSNLFVEHYQYDNRLEASTEFSGTDLGGNLNIIANIKNIIGLNGSIGYRRLTSYSYQSQQIGYPSYSLSISKSVMKNKLFIGLNFKDILETSSRTKSSTSDGIFEQFRRSNSQTRNIILQLSYSFGKQFYNNNSRNQLELGEEKTFKKL